MQLDLFKDADIEELQKLDRGKRPIYRECLSPDKCECNGDCKTIVGWTKVNKKSKV